jgi:carbonic anhydrase
MGRLQSPINLADTTSHYNLTAYPVYFNYHAIPNAALAWDNEGRVLQVKQVGVAQNLLNFGYMGFQRNGVIKQYALTGIELNFPAEHTIEGVQADVEIKLLHTKILPFESTVNQYRRIPDANTHLTISFLYKRNANYTDNGFINTLLSTWTGAERNANLFNYGGLNFNLDLNSYQLYEDRQFFFYEGSHTSEPFDEVVNVIVIKDNFNLSTDAYDLLTRIFSKYTNNVASKAVAELFGRNVTRNYMNITEAGSSYVSMNIVACLLVFLFLF